MQWCVSVIITIILLVSPGRAIAVDWVKLANMPAEWYVSDEGRPIIKNILARQRACGGWDKNYDPSEPVDQEQLNTDIDKPATIDNQATVAEMRVLARVIALTGDRRCLQAFSQGQDYLFKAQYENGGWPQYYPLCGSYHDAITYNDDAMYHVMMLMQEIASAKEPFTIINKSHRQQAADAYERGIRIILRTQVVVDGHPTVWCAQHDAVTLKPVKARAYEHPSLSGAESVKLIQLLMSIDDPSPDIVRAINGAVEWFDMTAIYGVSYERIMLPNGDQDRRLVSSKDTNERWWARFYEIGTNRPIFSGRDGVIHYELSEVEAERRLGYAWYSRRAESLLTKDYPAWRRRWITED